MITMFDMCDGASPDETCLTASSQSGRPTPETAGKAFYGQQEVRLRLLTVDEACTRQGSPRADGTPQRQSASRSSR
jgi:hypothetical protein